MRWNPWAQNNCSHENRTIMRWFENGTGMMAAYCRDCGSESRGPVIGIDEPTKDYPVEGFSR